MPMESAITVPYGDKTIVLKVRFFTDAIAENGQVLPKNAWTNGVVSLVANPAHGIPSGYKMVFNTLAEIGPAIEKVLVQAGIKLHPFGRMKHLMAA